MSKHIQKAWQELHGAVQHNKDHVSDMTLLLMSQLATSLAEDIKKAPDKFTAPFTLVNGVPPISKEQEEANARKWLEMFPKPSQD